MSLAEAAASRADHRDPQSRAADPSLSVFVTANAGSGKTKTLIDRVTRLLLAGAEPAAILCVTYTKAAAAEMQRRLFEQLGEWSVMAGAELAGRLTDLLGGLVDPDDAVRLSQARALFARALETPGGLKIQTIHAFCEKLLRRFPLEAGVSPGFRVMDDAASAAMAEAAKRGVARLALSGQAGVAEAYGRMSVALDFQSFQAMFATFEARRGALSQFFAREGGLDGAVFWVWKACGLAPGSAPQDLAAGAMAALDPELWREAAAVLAQGGKQDQARAATMAEVAAAPAESFEAALSLLFTGQGEGEPAKWVESTGGLKPREDLRGLLIAEQARLAIAREEVRAARVAEETCDALRLAGAYLEAYRIEKAYAGALDFTDLIDRACHLLRDGAAAAWVLYKLDGGIDHILLDEAQDTAPDQWKIVDALTEEFFSGADSDRDRALERNLFVVGDVKQSIYSFQGAQADLLTRQLEAHRRRAAGAGRELHRVDLLTSWRSTPEVLAFVDAVFAPPELAEAIQGVADEVRHEVAPYRAEHPGCVDVWPLESEPDTPERRAWDAPLDVTPEDSATRKLARKIAGEVRNLIVRGDAVYDKDLLRPDGKRGDWRPARAGDVLILVRRRRALFEEILRALKQDGVPVAGADRLALSEHIVFDDLLGLARFALFPRDELTLAALLRSPFCDVSDESLYELGRRREGENLWDRLQRRAPERPEWGGAAAFLARVIEEGRGARPFEFYGRLLGVADAQGRSMRRRLLRRLGAEAQDALDEFLAQVLAAESRGVRDLERLAFDFAGLSITVKREMEAARDEVRVMTAHGAKGLEAPIVFLPETTLSQTQRGSPLMETEDGGFLWCGAAARDCEPSAAARARRAKREEDEAYRLLYVALTRARDRLVLCGRLPRRADPAKLKGWWGAVAGAMAHEKIAPGVRTVRCGEMEVRRYGADPRALGRAAAVPGEAAPPPEWAVRPAPAEPFARFASPSDLGEGARVSAPSPLAREGGLGRFRRGELIHRLLQLLPELPPPDRARAAAALLAREPDLSAPQRAEMTRAALSVLEDARFAEVFGEGSRAEVGIAGSAKALPQGLEVSGRIDRLVVLPGRVLVVDFKTNRPSPVRIEDADPAYLRQIAIYWAVLAEVFPGRRIEAAIVWTDGPRLMAVPENLIAATLAGLSGAG
ncbi:MAG TPA: double-strand break repair helicase AddA [Phenylobacterium sp.]|uniref:double-strand break repair helicase AddA n=1 Tax=Phenylobacterium sp. TaxID=1871053 RepID=UPI002CA63F12|nr:double-strand break repair helicase AddA [Phenylobacterium sp.]HSV04766.1 double-strand break repair helicase AddA [Phenylobacterium sp.]